MQGFYPVRTEKQKEAVEKVRLCPGICGFYQSKYQTYCEDCICMMQCDVSLVGTFVDKFGGGDKIQQAWSYSMSKHVTQLYKQYARTFRQSRTFHDKRQEHERQKQEQKHQKQERERQEQEYKNKQNYEVESKTFSFTHDTALYVFDLPTVFDAGELRKKYISLACQWHPDKVKVHLHDVETCIIKMQEIHAMYDLLQKYIK